MVKASARFVAGIAILLLLPGPSEGAGAEGGPQTKYATHFFYWNNAQRNDPPKEKIAYHPPGYLQEYEEGGWYSHSNPKWWAREVADMTRARLDYVLPVCWGDHVHFPTSMLSNLVSEIRAQKSPLKVGIYDDGHSQQIRWWKEGGASGQLMPLDQPNWKYFYEKIKSFYTIIPKDLWATHNGLPAEKGGRPIVLTFTPEFYTNLDQADEMWAWVKKQFKEEFKAELWLLLDWNWKTANRDVDGVTDGYCIYSASIRGTRTFTHKGPTGQSYVCSNLGPGRDDRLIGKPENFTARRDGAWFKECLQRVPKNCDLAVIESWNELYEGSAICRAIDYPKEGGGTLPDTFYIDLLRDHRGGPAPQRRSREKPGPKFVPPVPEVKVLGSIAELMKEGKLGSALTQAKIKADSRNEEEAAEGKLLQKTLADFTAEVRGKLEQQKAKDPVGAVDDLKELAKQFRATSLGRELDALAREWDREPATDNARKAARVLDSIRSMAERMEKQGKKGDPGFVSYFRKKMGELEEKYPDTAACKEAKDLLKKLGVDLSE